MPSGVYKRTPEMKTGKFIRTPEMKTGKFIRTPEMKIGKYKRTPEMKTGKYPRTAKQLANMKKAQNRPEVKLAKSVANFQENHWNWQGGLTYLHGFIYNSFKYIQWRYNVFTRDKFTCQKCGDNQGGNLEAHHKKPIKVIFLENNITIYEEAINCSELWDINNGITLCKKCHEKERVLTWEQIKRKRER